MKKVLIVDDNRKTRMVYKMLLGKYDVLEAENGLEGCNQYKKYQPSIVLMDLRMPIMDGEEAMKKILAMDAAATIVIVTALANIDQTKILAAGAKQILTKPVQKNTLLNTIAAALA